MKRNNFYLIFNEKLKQFDLIYDQDLKIWSFYSNFRHKQLKNVNAV